MKSCPICSASTHPIDKDLYRCMPCKHTFSDLLIEDQESYDDDYFTRNPAYFGNPNVRLFDFIRKRLPEGEIYLLEIGCGKGDFLKFIRKKDPRAKLCGTDLIDNDLEGIRYIKGDFLSTDLGGKYNVVVALAVIEHFSDPLAFIRKVYQLSDGMVFMMTINDDSLLYRVARVLRRIGIRSAYDRFYYYHHLQHFSNSSLRKLIESNGFEVLEQVNHNHSVRSIDISWIQRIFVWCIFTLSFKSGMLQTVVCRKVPDLKAGIPLEAKR